MREDNFVVRVHAYSKWLLGLDMEHDDAGTDETIQTGLARLPGLASDSGRQNYADSS